MNHLCRIILLLSGKAMFGLTMTDSKIAQEYQCGRLKTAAVLKHLATDVKHSIESAMKSGLYCISTDGSNDQRDKQFPLVVSTIEENGIEMRLLCLPVLKEAATGDYFLCYLFVFSFLDSTISIYNV